MKYHLRIEPKKSLFDINLKELWAYRDLIALFVRRDFVALYKQTILGPLWFIIQPLLSTAMFTIVFAKIAQFSTANLPPIVFYLSGITNLIQFAIQFTLLALIIIYYSFNGYDFHFDLTLLLIPVMLLILAGLGLGFGILISSLTTKYRDLKQLISFGVQLWMYITPIIFPLSSVSGKYRIFFVMNPLTGIVETFRTILLGVGQMNFFYLGYSAAFMLVLLVIGVIMFNRIERNFMDYV